MRKDRKSWRKGSPAIAAPWQSAAIDNWLYAWRTWLQQLVLITAVYLPSWIILSQWHTAQSAGCKRTSHFLLTITLPSCDIFINLPHALYCCYSHCRVKCQNLLWSREWHEEQQDSLQHSLTQHSVPFFPEQLCVCCQHLVGGNASYEFSCRAINHTVYLSFSCLISADGKLCSQLIVQESLFQHFLQCNRYQNLALTFSGSSVH